MWNTLKFSLHIQESAKKVRFVWKLLIQISQWSAWWLIDLKMFYTVSAIFQPYNGGTELCWIVFSFWIWFTDMGVTHTVLRSTYMVRICLHVVYHKIYVCLASCLWHSEFKIILKFIVSVFLRRFFLFDCSEFFVPLKIFSLIWRCHHCRWRAANFDHTSNTHTFIYLYTWPLHEP